MGFVQWRPSFYVCGDLDNFMKLLDTFFNYVAKATAKEADIHITPHLKCNIDSVWDDLGYENYTLHEPNANPPLKFFEASPLFGKRVPTFSIEVHSDTNVSIVITQVFNFRDAFEAQGIQGGRMQGTAENPKGEFVRLMLKLDVSKQDQIDRVVKVLEEVLHNLAIRVTIDGKVEEKTAVSDFIAKLRERPNMHFV